MSRRINAKQAGIAGIVAALSAGALIIATSGSVSVAGFQDTAKVPAHVSFGSVDIHVAGSVDFANLKPTNDPAKPHVQTQTVTLTNTGSVGGDVVVGSPFTVSQFTVPTTAAGIDLSQVKIRVPGYVNSWTPLTQMHDHLAVGKLGAKDSSSDEKSVTFQVRLDSKGSVADSKFMGIDATGDFTATLTSD